jgi:hypothetical protein
MNQICDVLVNDFVMKWRGRGYTARVVVNERVIWLGAVPADQGGQRT